MASGRKLCIKAQNASPSDQLVVKFLMLTLLYCAVLFCREIDIE